MTAAAAGASYFFAVRREHASALRFIGIFVGAWLAQFLVWLVAKVILYPKLFSPLIGLPEPKNPSWFMGQWSRIRAEPSGAPMRDWCVFC